MSGTTLGTAYVQILPSAKGLGSAIKQSLDGDAGKAGKSAGLKISSGIKRVIAGAAIGGAITAGIKAALSEGGKLEQSYGGLETIYGKASSAAKAYAQNAASAGISANSYAEQAVSFGASLKQAFEGDTTKAVEAANTAILDMTDNAAKMGTPIESIQMAYQGFAKQNYTMLDNLKIGYGGTKTEMERLLTDAQKLSGQKYDISNLGDVYEAIHVIQGDLGLTGVAAAEASTTFEGSFNAMKASASNLLGNLALGENVASSMNTFASSISSFLFGNLIPMVGTVFKSLPEAASTFIQEGLPKLKGSGAGLIEQIVTGAQSLIPMIPTMLGGMVTTFGTYAPQLISAGSEIIGKLGEGLTSAIPSFLANVLPMITRFTEFLRANAGTLISAGLGLIQNIAQGLINSIPLLISYVPTIITNLAGIINDNAPKVLVTGITIIKNLVMGLINAIPTIVANIPKIIQAIVSVWFAFNWLNMGKSVITFIKNGFENLKTAIPETLKNIAETAKDWFSAINWSTLGADVIDLILIGLETLASAIPTAIKGIATTAFKLFKSVNWISVGKAAITLIGSGIKGSAGAIKGAISGIVNNVKSRITVGFTAAKAIAVKTFTDMKFKILGALNPLVSKVMDIVNRIKGFFPLKIGKIFSGIKLPHFSVSGSPPFGIGGKGTKPSISVSWYKKAMENPYLFSNATLFGAGEAGDEVLYGRSALMKDIASAVDASGSKGGNSSVTVTNYITVDGAENPEDFAVRFARKFEMEMRTA